MLRLGYLNALHVLECRPFGMLSDEELNYAVPLFFAEVVKKDSSPYLPASLRSLVLSLQKFIEVNGCHVKFLSDDKFKPIRDTLDAVMKRSASLGFGLSQ